jgi:rod shape determining protein RodA
MSVVVSQRPLHQRALRWFDGYDRPFLAVVGVLLLLGLVIMYSAAQSEMDRFYSQLRNVAAALVVMLAVSQINPQTMRRFAVPAYVIGVLLLVAVELFGITRKGSTRWLNVGMVIQPSEMMKIAMPLMLAWWFQLREGKMRALDFAVAGLILAVPVALIVKQPDLGTSLLVLASGLFVIYFAGLSWRLIIPPVALVVIGIGVLVVMESSWCQPGVDWVVLHDYQKQRVCTLLDPTKDPLGSGFHIIQGIIAIGAGGIMGQGWLQGSQTQLEFVPEHTTDFIFTAFAEEFGMVGVWIMLALYAYLILRGLWIAAQGSTLFARLLGAAMALIFFVYAFVNIAMVSGLLPVVGVPLPLISYGGTALVTLGMAVGILMSIARTRQLVQS